MTSFCAMTTKQGNNRISKAKNDLPSCVIRLWYNFQMGRIRGGNAIARAVAAVLLDVVKRKTASNEYQAICNDHDKCEKYLNGVINSVVKILFSIRHNNISMCAAVTRFKTKDVITDDKRPANMIPAHIPPVSDSLCNKIEAFVEDMIMGSVRSIAAKVEAYLAELSKRHRDAAIDGSGRQSLAVVTYGRSSAIEASLRLAHENAKTHENVQYEIICVDSPLHEGRALALALASAGIPVTFVTLPALTSLLMSKRPSIVLLGAAGMASSGHLIARAGTSAVALLACHFRIPVVVCCESYKFTNQLWLGSLIEHNEPVTGPSMQSAVVGTPCRATVVSAALDADAAGTDTCVFTMPLVSLRADEGVDAIVPSVGGGAAIGPDSARRKDAKKGETKAATAVDRKGSGDSGFTVGATMFARTGTAMTTWREDGLKILDVLYDVTPPEHIDLVACEQGVSFIPPQSVAAVLRGSDGRY